MRTDEAIEYVKALARIIARDNNFQTVWEIHCQRTEDGVALGIYHLLNATEQQKQEALNASRK